MHGGGRGAHQESGESLSEGAREARIALKALRKEKEEEDVNLEGQLYGAGIAD